MRINKIFITLSLAAMFFSGSVFALSLSEAKSQLLVGETSSGYLGAVKPSSEVNALVSSINAKRKAHYQNISTKNGTSLSAVEKLAGEKAIKRTPGGQYVNSGSGWRIK